MSTPIVGPVYGFRTWDVSPGRSSWLEDTGPHLESRGTIWERPKQYARCITGFGQPGKIWFSSSDMEADDSPDHASATAPNCWCGLYAHSTLGRCLDQNGPFFKWSLNPPSKVLGLVSASGHMFAADRGFRAQVMTVDTLVCIHSSLRTFRHPIAGPHQPYVREIAEQLGAHHVCAQLNKPSLTAAFADREGVYLWRKEAPWISDVTPERTKSSSRPKGKLDPKTGTYVTTPPDPTLIAWHRNAVATAKSQSLRDITRGGGVA